MITIKQTTDSWAIHGGFHWEVTNEYSESTTFFSTYEEAISYLSTLNYTK